MTEIEKKREALIKGIEQLAIVRRATLTFHTKWGRGGAPSRGLTRLRRSCEESVEWLADDYTAEIAYGAPVTDVEGFRALWPALTALAVDACDDKLARDEGREAIKNLRALVEAPPVEKKKAKKARAA